MSHVFTPTPVAPTTLTLPDDGDLASATSITGAVESNANAIKYHQNAIDGTTPGILTPQDIDVAGGAFSANATAVNCTATLYCASDCNVAGATACAFTLDVTGATVLHSTLAVTGATACAGVTASSLTVTGSLVANSTGVETDKLLIVNSGITHRTLTLNDANQTVTVATADVFFMPNLSADRSYVMSTTGASEGQWVRFVATNNVGGFIGTVFASAFTVQMAAHAPIAGTTQTTTLDFRFRAGVWILEQRVAWY